MRTGLLVLVAVSGGVVGVAVGYSLTRPQSSAQVLEPRADADSDAHPFAAESAQPTVGSTTAGRADLYRTAAAAPRGQLDAMIREAAAAPRGAERTFELSLLLTRYAELDPRAAVDAAAGFGAELRAPLYAAWAKKDPASALAALAAVQDRAVARTIAAALVGALGGDDRALREVTAAVPFGMESAVYADALTARATETPAIAFRQALELTDPAARSQSLEGIAEQWGRVDPRAALTAVDEIHDPAQRQAFLMSVGKTWARLDPDASLAYLKSMDSGTRPELLWIIGSQLAELRPRDLLDIAGTNTPASQQLRMLAIRGLASQDPMLAMREADALPAGGQREGALSEIARVYGARDPDAALAWARASNDMGRLMGVLQGIAQRDPTRAFDLAVALESPQQRWQAVQYTVMMAPTLPGATGSPLADRVLALADGDLRVNILRQLLSRWSQTAPDAAVEWLIAHEVSTQGSYLEVAQQLARGNPARAADYTARVPSSARAEWIQGVASGYAQSDPQAAAQWLEQYRGDPAYSAAAVSVASGLARSDPAAAARLLLTAKDPELAIQGAYSIAVQWAQRDPRAAAAWAADYDARVGRAAVSPNVVGVWAQSDAAAARAWTMRMTSGPARDSALGSLLSARPAETIDALLLDAFSNPQARNQAVANTAMRLGNSDRAAALKLLDDYLPDERLREQARRNIERISTNIYYDANGFGQIIR